MNMRIHMEDTCAYLPNPSTPQWTQIETDSFCLEVVQTHLPARWKTKGF